MKKQSIFSRPLFFVLFALIVTALWGSAFPMVKLGYEYYEITQTGDKIFFAAARFMLAGAVLLLVNIIKKKPETQKRGFSNIKLNKEQIKWVLLLALVQITGNYFFYYIGLSNTAGSIASIVNSCDTFLSVLIVGLFFKSDKLTPNKIIGAVIGLFGIVIVNLNGGNFGGFSLYGEGFILVSSLFSTFGIIINKKVATALNPIVATGYFLFIGGGVLLGIALAMGGSINLLNIKADLVLLYLTFVSGCAFVLWSSLLRHNDVSKTGVFKLLIPVFGNVLSALILQENILSFSRLVSVVLVAAGIGLVNYNFSKNKQSKLLTD